MKSTIWSFFICSLRWGNSTRCLSGWLGVLLLLKIIVRSCPLSCNPKNTEFRSILVLNPKFRLFLQRRGTGFFAQNRYSAQLWFVVACFLISCGAIWIIRLEWILHEGSVILIGYVHVCFSHLWGWSLASDWWGRPLIVCSSLLNIFSTTLYMGDGCDDNFGHIIGPAISNIISVMSVYLKWSGSKGYGGV